MPISRFIAQQTEKLQKTYDNVIVFAEKQKQPDLMKQEDLWQRKIFHFFFFLYF